MIKNLIYQIKYLMIIIALMLCCAIKSANIIFDLGGVLIDKKGTVAFKMLGIRNIVSFMASKRCFPTTMKKILNQKLYEILNKKEIATQLAQTSNYYGAKDDNGVLLPPIMCSWLEGTIPCEKIRTVVSHSIDEHPEWFSSQTEQRMIKSLIRLIFTPEKFCQMMKFNSNTIKFVRKCKEGGHQVYVLSNWDKESFSLLQQKHRKIFDIFDGIVISGEHFCAKPNKKIYQKLIAQYSLNPDECIFFDDQVENCDVAKELGIATIHYEKNKKFFGSKRNRNKTLRYITAIHCEQNKKVGLRIKHNKTSPYLLTKNTSRLSCFSLNKILSNQPSLT